MVTIGLDPHPYSHTVAALDENGTARASLTVSNEAEGSARLHLVSDEQGAAEARILWRTLGSALDGMGGPPLPEQSWAERPLTVLLQLVRFLLTSNQQAWLR